MATDYFAIGSIISCKTCYNESIEGEVLAYDYDSRMLAIKCTQTKAGKHCDVQLLNMNFISENSLQILSEPPDSNPPLPHIDLQKINKRMQQNKEEKLRRVNSIGIGVTPKAQSLFNTISKTLREVRWDGDKIIVLDEVVIKPPYGIDNCQSRKESANHSLTVEHLQKIIIKHNEDEGHRDLRKSQSSSPASSVSS